MQTVSLVPIAGSFCGQETDAVGKRVRRTAFIGTVDANPTKELAQQAANGLRMRVNEDRNRESGRDIAVEDLVDHYIHTELSEGADWHSLATRIVYRAFLKRWVRPAGEKQASIRLEQ